MPGTSSIEIQVWDHDNLSRDDLMGIATIDIEDRFFSRLFTAYKNKTPIETRSLYHPSSDIQRGQLRCWVDLFDRCECSKIEPALEIQDKPDQL
jgi:hypothetical protein